MSSAGLKPVMVFLYGGGFDRGSINNPAYNGAYLAAAQDVVVVTFNYRVNIFGFSNAPGADTNVGIRDMRLAIEWVRDNIEAFGGDATRLTLFGQSQGAILISYYAYAFPDNPMASSFIQQSVNAFSGIQQDVTVKTDVWRNASAAVGCNRTSDADILSCMRAQNVSNVLVAWGAVQPETALTLPFGPVVDDELVFANYTQQTLSGKYAQLPLLLGSNENEAGFYVLRYAGIDQITLTQKQQDEIGFGLYTSPTSFEANLKAQALATTKPTIPVYRYLYFGDWPNLRLYAGSGAYHTFETSMIFGTMKDLGGEPDTALEVQVSQYLQSAWAAFARDPVSGLSAMDWPAYNQSASTLIRLGFGNETTASYTQPGVYDTVCDTL